MIEEERYSNRQIERLLDEQSRDIKEHIDSKTKPIFEQTLKTNGRVTKNEVDITSAKVWRGWMTGALAVISILLPIVVTVQGWEILQIVKTNATVTNLPNEIRAAVGDELNNRVRSVEVAK